MPAALKPEYQSCVPYEIAKAGFLPICIVPLVSVDRFLIGGIDDQPVYSLLRHIFFAGGYPSQPEISDVSVSLSATAALCRNT